MTSRATTYAFAAALCLWLIGMAALIHLVATPHP